MGKYKIGLLFLLVFSVNAVFAQDKGMLATKHNFESEPPYRNSWALLIGINNYRNLPIEFQLKYAINDVKSLKELLVEKYGFSEDGITVLTDNNATRQNIIEAMGQLANTEKVGKDDRVLVYFSGHGQTIALKNSGEMGYILPYDANVNMNDTDNPAPYYTTCIGMDELKRLSQLIPAKHVLFLMDACYSGLATSSKGGLKSSIPDYLNTVSSLMTRQIITAGLKGEKSYEDPSWGHGAFTYKLLEALNTGSADENSDGITTGMELATHLRNFVPTISPKQTPDYGRFEGEGEFLFIEKTHETKIESSKEQDQNANIEQKPEKVTSEEKIELPQESEQKADKETSQAPKEDAVKEIIAAEVNEKPIYLSDVTRELDMITGGRVNKQDTATYNMLKDQVLNSLINQEIIYQAGQKEGLEPKEEELTAQLEKVKSMQPPEQFQQALKAFGLTEEKLALIIKRNMTIRKFIEVKIQPTIKPITDEAISIYYETNKEKYAEPEQVRARHILIKVSPDANEQQKTAAKEKIQGILDKVRNGGDFVELAKEYSECPSASKGGDLDYFRRGMMVKPFEDAAFALQPGGVSDIVETEFGYHIIKFEDKKAGKQLAIEEVKPKIEDALSQKEMDQALGDWLKPERDKASIKFLLKADQPSAPESTEQ